MAKLKEVKVGDYLAAKKDLSLGGCFCSLDVKKGDIVKAVDKDKSEDPVMVEPSEDSTGYWLNEKELEEFERISKTEIAKARKAYNDATRYKYANVSAWRQ